MRPLWLAAPADPAAWTVEDEYLLGPDLLVAPVVRPGVATRPVYLPAGRWREYWTGQVRSGPGPVTVAAEQIPLFVRDGADLVLPGPASLGLTG